MRLLVNAPFNDRTSTEELLEKTGLLSVNQLAASIKLIEVWKGLNIPNYPIQLEPNNPTQLETVRQMRPTTTRLWNQDAKSMAAKCSFSRNAAKLWNGAPLNIKTTVNLNSAKKEITKYCKTLPI